jgi:hypothetical protein
VGFESASNLAEETHEPNQVIPKAMLRAVLVSGVVGFAFLETVPDMGGVIFVPALAGLGAPYWAPGARGLLTGLHLGTERGHLARAGFRRTRSCHRPLPRWAGSCCAARGSAGWPGWRSGRAAGSWPGPARSGWCLGGRCTLALPG